MRRLRACLHGGGGLQIGEVTFGGSPHLSCKRDQIKMRDMDRRVTQGLSQLSGLPHLPGVPHLHVNRPLIGSMFDFIPGLYIQQTAVFFSPQSLIPGKHKNP